MNAGCRAVVAAIRGRHLQSGTVLVVALLLLAVMTVLAVSGVAMASLELQQAGNEQYQEQAFRAAEAGIEQALAAGTFTTDLAAIAGQYDQPAAVDPTPIRGTGRAIAGCEAPSGPASEPCEYFLRFDHATGPTAVPGAAADADPGLRAYHFVVDSYGVAARGARSHQVQGFYVAGTDAGALSAPPVPSYWLELGLDAD